MLVTFNSAEIFLLGLKGRVTRGEGAWASFIVLVQMGCNFSWMWQKKLGWSSTNIGKLFCFKKHQYFIDGICKPLTKFGTDVLCELGGAGRLDVERGAGTDAGERLRAA
jgi:hypothetical protein